MGGGYGNGSDDGSDDDGGDDGSDDDGGDDGESELSFHLTCAPYKQKFER